MGGTGAVAPRCIHVHGVAPGPRVTLLHPGSLRPGLGLWPTSQSQAGNAKKKKIIIVILTSSWRPRA